METEEQKNQKNEILFAMTDEARIACHRALLSRAAASADVCTKCGLSKTRSSVVFGEGNPDTRLMFVGEGPGADEDAQGVPFVGKAGQLLTQILTAAGIDRREIFITNVVKCRPPENRTPEFEEMAACDDYLQTQIAVIQPAILVLLGAVPTKWILKTNEGISKLRGKWFEWKNIAVMPMFHPSYLLRFANKEPGSPKHLTWLDIQEVKRRYDEECNK